MTILLVEDELLLARIVTESLTERGFTMFHASDTFKARQLLLDKKPDLIILDVMLPRQDGFSFAAELRRDKVSLPIIFLTAKNQPQDVVQGFESGGNDYLRKPFSMEELIVRVRELLRRHSHSSEAIPDPVFTIGGYHFDSTRQLLTRPNGSTQQLSHRESELLKLLCLSQNRVLPRRDALLELWGDDSIFNGRSMDVFITKIRRYLADDASIQIFNVRGVGYKMVVVSDGGV
jgi:two-component system, OmpR family, response regulator VicR